MCSVGKVQTKKPLLLYLSSTTADTRWHELSREMAKILDSTPGQYRQHQQKWRCQLRKTAMLGCNNVSLHLTTSNVNTNLCSQLKWFNGETCEEECFWEGALGHPHLLAKCAHLWIVQLMVHFHGTHGMSGCVVSFMEWHAHWPWWCQLQLVGSNFQVLIVVLFDHCSSVSCGCPKRQTWKTPKHFQLTSLKSSFHFPPEVDLFWHTEDTAPHFESIPFHLHSLKKSQSPQLSPFNIAQETHESPWRKSEIWWFIKQCCWLANCLLIGWLSASTFFALCQDMKCGHRKCQTTWNGIFGSMSQNTNTRNSVGSEWVLGSDNVNTVCMAVCELPRRQSKVSVVRKEKGHSIEVKAEMNGKWDSHRLTGHWMHTNKSSPWTNQLLVSALCGSMKLFPFCGSCDNMLHEAANLNTTLQHELVVKVVIKIGGKKHFHALFFASGTLLTERFHMSSNFDFANFLSFGPLSKFLMVLGTQFLVYFSPSLHSTDKRLTVLKSTVIF